ncbi:ABC transporter permease [Saccharomonospora viridis]|jgi:ABC-2 type transport system permease protein|uniref:Sodium ABC transporter permease n=1 Tax=Saccharomonospora viridis TaxID=1852 RepID=A0A837D317_9PSEU|nr:ABC transporter permease [Saccharomonospora viridis]KHF42209.1 sodium ABC transporter permease [Saccharomonospora viridis]SFP46556.1 ABC-2 type transport system permease protein [Saccharomonospora viridis]
MSVTTQDPQHRIGDASERAGKGTSFAAATWLVAEREIKSFVRTKGFWIGFSVIIVALFATSILPKVFASSTSVAVVDSSANAVLEQAEIEVVSVTDVAAAEDLVREEEVDAAVVPDPTGESVTGVRVIALSSPPSEVVAALGTTPPVDLLEESEVGHGERTLVIMAFALLFLMFGIGGVAIAQSTVTEKQTRIVEILVATVPVRALLAGKILGHALLTLGQVVVVAIAAPIAVRLGDHGELVTVLLPALGWFVPFMCLGFLLLAAMWAVSGAVVSRQEDLGSSMSFVMLLVMGPYFAVLMLSDNATAMTVLSFVPFSAPVAMPVRAFTEDAQPWEALASLGVLAASVVVITVLAARLYSGALLQTKGKVALTKAWARAE